MHCFIKTMSQSSNKFIKSMSQINHLPQTIQKALQNKALLKVISGLNNFDIRSVEMITKAASLGGADMVDIASSPMLVEKANDVASLPICISSVEPKAFIDSVKAGASMIEIGNYDSFYEQGITFSPKQILDLTKETKDLLPEIPLSVTVPHNIPLDKQVDLSVKLFHEGVTIIQTEGGTSSMPYSAGIKGLIEKATPTLSSTYAIKTEFARCSIDMPIMSASGLSEVSAPLAIASGASAVGVGSAINKINDLLSMIAAVRGLRESLTYSLIQEKIS